MSRGPVGRAGRGPTGGGGRRPGGPTRPTHTGGKTRRGCGLLALQAALAALTAATGVGMTACRHTAPAPAESPRPLMSGRQAAP